MSTTPTNKSAGLPWTAEEHDRFLRGLDMFPKGPWKRVAEIVRTRTTRQTMTHAQKYRQKMERRLKRKQNLNAKRSAKHVATEPQFLWGDFEDHPTSPTSVEGESLVVHAYDSAPVWTKVAQPPASSFVEMLSTPILGIAPLACDDDLVSLFAPPVAVATHPDTSLTTTFDVESASEWALASTNYTV